MNAFDYKGDIIMNKNNHPLKTDNPVLLDLLEDPVVFDAIVDEDVDAICDMVSNEKQYVKNAVLNVSLIGEYMDDTLDEIDDLPSILFEQVYCHIRRSIENGALYRDSDYRRLVITMLINQGGISSFRVDNCSFKITVDDFKFGCGVVVVKYDQDDELQKLISIITNEDRKVLIEFIENADPKQLTSMKDTMEEIKTDVCRNFCTD